MSRLEKLLKKWGVSSIAFKQQHICLDIGSSWTKIIVDGKFVMQPTCVLQHLPTGAVIAIGEKAEQLSATTLKDTVTIYPVQQAKIVNTQVLEQYLHILLQPYIHHDLASFFFSPHINLATLYADRSSQSKACSQLLQPWARKIKIQPMASALWAISQQHRLPSSGCVIDIGAMTTKFFMLADGVVVASHITEEGGQTVTQDIQQFLRQNYKCSVGWHTAEVCKKRLAQYYPDSNNSAESQLLIHGKDVLSSLPTSIMADARVCDSSLKACADRLVQGFQQLCQSTSPEFVADIQRAGIYLSGGGSQLRGLQKILEKKLRTKIVQSAHPQRDVVQGLWLAQT